MERYITSVAIAAVMAGFADNFVPKSWQRYVSLLTGAILLITLITPFLNLRNIEPLKLGISEDDYISYNIENEVVADLSKRIEEDIRERLFSEFGIKTEAKVKLKIENDTIMGVEKISLNCKKRNDVTALLTELYGCDDIRY